MALIRVYEQKARANGFISEVLGQPSSSAGEPTSAYMSAINTLQNGTIMIQEAEAELRPQPTKDELDRMIFQWQLQHLDSDRISSRLAEFAGTGRLNRVNQSLQKSATVVNSAFDKLANCFRAAECRAGDQFQRMCGAVRGIRDSLQESNAAAQAIRGIYFNRSGTVPMLGGGTMDANFNEISAPNVTYLNAVVCM
jgi:hypothetical protein